MFGSLMALGASDVELREARDGARQLLGFLYSTPAYWPSLDLFGWRERGERLHALSRAGSWDAMGDVVSDEMLETFVPSARYGEIPDLLRERYAALTDWLTFPMPEDPARDPEASRAIAALQG